MSAASQAPRGATLREILTIVFRDRWRIAAAFLLGLVLTGIAAMLVPKKYTSEASLLLRLGREYIYTPEIGDATSGTPIAYDREQTLQAEVKILTSRDLKETVLQKLGVAQVYPALATGNDPTAQRDAAVVALEGGLDAELLKGSNLMEVSFTHRDPAVAAKVLAEFIDAYLKKRSTVFASTSFGTAEADFVARTIQLNTAEARLAELKKTRGIRAFGEEQSLLLAQRNALELRHVDAAVSLAQAQGRAGSLQGSLQGVTGDVTLSSETQRSEAVENARKLLLDLKLKERDLSSRYVDGSPLVQDVRADIGRTEDYLRELEARPTRVVRTGRSPARDAVETDLLRTLADQGQARRAASTVAAQRAALQVRLDTFAATERELQSLERERRLAEVSYEAAAKRLRDEMVLEELDRKRKSNVSIVQAPRVPLKAKAMLPLVLGVGIFLSLFAALLTAFLSALWRDTFLAPEEVERSLGLPLLAAVPEGAR